MFSVIYNIIRNAVVILLIQSKSFVFNVILNEICVKLKHQI